jgi:hypothetical protein
MLRYLIRKRSEPTLTIGTDFLWTLLARSDIDKSVANDLIDDKGRKVFASIRGSAQHASGSRSTRRTPGLWPARR